MYRKKKWKSGGAVFLAVLLSVCQVEGTGLSGLVFAAEIRDSLSGDAELKEDGGNEEAVSSNPGGTAEDKSAEEQEIVVTPAEEAGGETDVPIYNYDVVNVAVPDRFAVALNPYELSVETGDGKFSSSQIVSRNYGIVNKSSRDKIVTVTLLVEDLNEDKITFVDCAEEAENAAEDTYAVYLALVPAGAGKVEVNGAEADKDTTADDLSDVSMDKAGEQSVALHAGSNQISFKLTKALYDFESVGNLTLDVLPADDAGELFGLTGLAPDGTGVTAFTFDGAMNKKADWEKLKKGIRISAAYSYENVNGDETIAGGTGCMIKAKGSSAEKSRKD